MTKKILGKITLFGVVFCCLVIGLGVLSIAHPAKAADGDLVLAPNGTVYLIGQGERRPFKYVEVFNYYGYDF
jgi:hypothetical protein